MATAVQIAGHSPASYLRFLLVFLLRLFIVFTSFLSTNFTFLNMKDPTNLETAFLTLSTPAMLPVLSSSVMKWLPSTSPPSVPWDDIACRCKPWVLCGLSTFLLQCPHDSDYNATLGMKTWIPCHFFVPLYLTIFKFKSEMTGCLSMTGRLQNLPPTTTMYNMHIKQSSRATAHLIL